MINYIKAELYRISRKKSNMIYFAVVFILVFVSIFTISTNTSSNESFKTSDLIQIAMMLLAMVPLFIGIPIFLTVYNDELSAKSLSNVVSTGLTKVQIPIAKLIIATIFTIIMFLIATVVYFIIYFFAMGSFAGLGANELSNIFTATIVRFLSTIAFFSVAGIIAYAFQKSSITIVALILLLVGLVNQIVSLLPLLNDGLRIISDNTLSNYVSTATSALMDGTSISSSLYIAVVVYIVISLALSTLIISKRDIEVG